MKLPKFLSHKIGKQQEQNAKSWLECQGLNVIEENFHCKGGEIDLIAVEPKTKVLIFIEVKYRASSEFGQAVEFVTLSKQQRIQRCAQFYHLKHPDYQAWQPRFDVVAIDGEKPPQWLQNAF